MRLDFSQFHPLDHRPAGSRCRSLPGGTRNHLRLAWQFHRREQALAPLYRLILCPLGRHAEQVWYRDNEDGTQTVMPCCRYCRWTRLPSEADIDQGDQLPRFG
jgi:hypothetical protein